MPVVVNSVKVAAAPTTSATLVNQTTFMPLTNSGAPVPALLDILSTLIFDISDTF